MTKHPIKPVSLSDDETLEILHTLARQAGAEPKEVLHAILKDVQKSGKPVRVQKIWSLKSLFEHWKKEEGDAFLNAPLSGDIVKQVTDALKTRLKDTEVALREADSAAHESTSARARRMTLSRQNEARSLDDSENEEGDNFEDAAPSEEELRLSEASV
jgi:hypothetical protein